MKHLTTYINEDKIRYEISKDYEQKTEKILNDFVKDLPIFPGVSGKHVSSNNGVFWFNKYDIVRYGLAESSQYIGYPQYLHLYLDSKNNDINIDVVKTAFKHIFGARIDEGIFGNNITKELPEYEWVMKFYDVLSKYFGTKNFNVHWDHRYGYKWSPSIYKEDLLLSPTTKKDGLMVSLYNIDLSDLEENDEYCKIDMIVFVYEEKDKEKVATIKAQNDARKPLDIIGRELKEGDLIAFAGIGGYGSYKGMLTGKVIAASKDQVKLDNGKSVYANRCCLIARKDGKMIE